MPVTMVALLVGCAAEPGKPKKEEAPLVIIALEKTQSSGADCPVVVKITNRMQGKQWDGVSYHLSLLNRSNTNIASLIGAPHRATAPGGDLLDATRVMNVKCDDIAGVAVIYFGYYPVSKAQASVHLNRVRASIK